MMKIDPQPEPYEFDAQVRQPGKKHLQQLPPFRPVPNAFWKNREYWRRALGNLYSAYHGICAYLSIYIEPVTGDRSADHFKPKSWHPDLAYEWSNLRLVCGTLNSRKRDHQDVLDPFQLPPDIFDLNPTTGELIFHRDCPPSLRKQAESTIGRDRLNLNDPQCCFLRREHITKILTKSWTLGEATSRSPFITRRLQAQNLI